MCVLEVCKNIQVGQWLNVWTWVCISIYALCVYLYIHETVNERLSAYARMYVWLSVSMCISMNVLECVHACVNLCLFVSLCMSVLMCVTVSEYTCECVCAHVVQCWGLNTGLRACQASILLLQLELLTWKVRLRVSRVSCWRVIHYSKDRNPSSLSSQKKSRGLNQESWQYRVCNSQPNFTSATTPVSPPD